MSGPHLLLRHLPEELRRSVWRLESDLTTWSDSQAGGQPVARVAASDAVEAVDAAAQELHQLRAWLVDEIGAIDDGNDFEEPDESGEPGE